MNKFSGFFIGLFLLFSKPAKADFFGGDIPLLIEIVSNTLSSLRELQSQTSLLQKELRDIDDAIWRLKTIQALTKPEDFAAWKDPNEALRRLQTIYYTLPPKFRTEKSNEIEQQISRAMNLSALLVQTAKPAFDSGKELEKKSLEAGPAVAQKMGASGIGTLVALESQNQVAQATIISMLSHMIAEGASKEAARINSESREYRDVSSGLKSFSRHIKLPAVQR